MIVNGMFPRQKLVSSAFPVTHLAGDKQMAQSDAHWVQVRLDVPVRLGTLVLQCLTNIPEQSLSQRFLSRKNPHVTTSDKALLSDLACAFRIVTVRTHVFTGPFRRVEIF